MPGHINDEVEPLRFPSIALFSSHLRAQPYHALPIGLSPVLTLAHMLRQVRACTAQRREAAAVTALVCAHTLTCPIIKCGPRWQNSGRSRVSAEEVVGAAGERPARQSQERS